MNKRKFIEVSVVSTLLVVLVVVWGMVFHQWNQPPQVIVYPVPSPFVDPPETLEVPKMGVPNDNFTCNVANENLPDRTLLIKKEKVYESEVLIKIPPDALFVIWGWDGGDWWDAEYNGVRGWLHLTWVDWIDCSKVQLAMTQTGLGR